MNNHNILKKIIASGGFFLLALALFSGLLYYIHTLQGEVATLRGSADGALAENDRVRAEQSLLRETATKRAELSSYFYTSEEVILLLDELEALGRRTNASVEISSVYEEEADEDTEATIRIVLSTEGSWSNVYTFFAELELLPIALEIARANIEKQSTPPNAEGAQVEFWRGLFELNVYKELTHESS